LLLSTTPWVGASIVTPVGSMTKEICNEQLNFVLEKSTHPL
jgi:hypothetical protein